jgi:hypothetical protein
MILLTYGSQSGGGAAAGRPELRPTSLNPAAWNDCEIVVPPYLLPLESVVCTYTVLPLAPPSRSAIWLPHQVCEPAPFLGARQPL